MFSGLMGRVFGGADQREAARVEPDVMAAEPSTTKKPADWMLNIGYGATPAVRGLPRVSPAAAEGHATVSACCSIISGDLSKVPLRIWQRGDDGSERIVREHDADFLLNVEACDGVSAMITRFALNYSLCLRGRAAAYAPRLGDGSIEMIEALLPDRWDMLRNGRARFYDFTDGAGRQRRAPSRSIVHLRYMALDGWTGRSPIEVAAASMGLVLARQDSAARLAGGGVSKAVIKLADTYDDDEKFMRTAQRIKSAITDTQGDGIPVLGVDEEIQRLDLTAADLELLSAGKFDREQVAGIYRMPPSKLQMLEYGVKANGEQQAIDYRSDCLSHWGAFVESQMTMTILTREERARGLFLRHDFTDLMTPTMAEQYSALVKAVGGPIMSANTAQRMARLPVTDGDDDARLNPAANMTRAEAAKSQSDQGSSEGDE